MVRLLDRNGRGRWKRTPQCPPRLVVWCRYLETATELPHSSQLAVSPAASPAPTCISSVQDDPMRSSKEFEPCTRVEKL